MKLSTKLKILLIIAVVIAVSHYAAVMYSGSVNLFNASKTLNIDYSQKEQEQVTLYDAKYLAFTEKSKITNVNKETFVTVTEIIMSNRKDGPTLAWKWVTENQQIPYSEFTKFYEELSLFVSSQYAELLQVEKEKQAIVAQHNKLIALYPNNIYNMWLHIPPMVYKFGYISSETKTKFNIK